MFQPVLPTLSHINDFVEDGYVLQDNFFRTDAFAPVAPPTKLPTSPLSAVSNSPLAEPAIEPSSQSIDSAHPPPHWYSRTIHPLTHLSYFHCYNICFDFRSVYPIHYYLDYSRLSTFHMHFICQISSNFEPKTYTQAIKHSHWKVVIDSEYRL